MTAKIEHSYHARSKLLILRIGGHEMRIVGVTLDRAQKLLQSATQEFEKRVATSGEKRALDEMFLFHRSFGDL